MTPSFRRSPSLFPTSPVLALLAVFSAWTGLTASPALALESKGQQACIQASHKGFLAIAAAEGRAAGKCIKAVALGTAVDASVQACLTADAGGKIASAKSKASAAIAKACAGNVPDFGPTDATGAVVVGEAAGLRAGILETLFGSDIDAALATKAGDPASASCQDALVKAVDRCWKARMTAYAACAKSGLVTSIASAADLGACRDDDTKGAVAKACVADVQSVLDKKCAGVSLDTRLPGCRCQYPGDCLRITLGNVANAALAAAAGLPAAATMVPDVRVPQAYSSIPWITPNFGEIVASHLHGRQADAPMACPLAAINVYTVQDADDDAAYTAAVSPLLADQGVRVLFKKDGPVDLTGSSPALLVQGTQATPLYADARDFLHLSTRREVAGLIALKHGSVGDTLNYAFETCLFNCESIYAETSLPNIVFPGRLVIIHFTADRATIESAVTALAEEAATAADIDLAWMGRVVADYRIEQLGGVVVPPFAPLGADGSLVYEIGAGVDPTTDLLTLPVLSSFLAAVTNEAVMVTP